MNDDEYPMPMSTSVVPVPVPRTFGPADPDLQARIEQAAAALGTPLPIVFSGAAASILPVSLPLNSARRRRAALPFALEPALAQPVDEMLLALGPHVSEDVWISVAASRDVLDHLPGDLSNYGPLLPDTLAVPMPLQPDSWALWCGETQCHIRLADGTGLAVLLEDVAELWRACGAPDVALVHGAPPPGMKITRTPLPPLDPTVLKVDLSGDVRPRWMLALGGFGRFATAVILLSAIAHIGLVRADAGYLAELVRDGEVRIQTRLNVAGLDLVATAPFGLIEAAISKAVGNGARADPFLVKLTSVMAAQPLDLAIDYRELRYDATDGSLILHLNAPDLESLQSFETALQRAGLPAKGGAATRGDAGAEMQIVIAEGL